MIFFIVLQEENLLVLWLKAMAKEGMPVEPRQLLDSVEEIIKKMEGQVHLLKEYLAMKEYRSINEHPVKPEPFETVFLNMKQEVEESEDDADGGWAASCAETVLLPVDMSGGGVAVKQEPGSGDDPTCEPLGVAVTYTDGKHLISTRPSSETSPSEDAARQ
ncbi:uncharacterized protein LOC134527184 isoform X4 [Bacillus rossius redtenbacheri]|uniref:uncharacterized protein LOC134527184 isoform X4 n=1 Tax=Bacillus rossius redtenbacheri TaxID=93214 RepID=UPI002FDE6729